MSEQDDGQEPEHSLILTLSAVQERSLLNLQSFAIHFMLVWVEGVDLHTELDAPWLGLKLAQQVFSLVIPPDTSMLRRQQSSSRL